MTDEGMTPVASDGAPKVGLWTCLFVARYDTTRQYPIGLVAQIRSRFPSPCAAATGVQKETDHLRQLAEQVNQAILSGSPREFLALRAEFAKGWERARSPSATGDRYCVGGAFLAFSSFPGAGRFPTPGTLGTALLRSNRKLSPQSAESFARDMLVANDTGDFELAWRILEDALAFGRERTHAPMGTIHAARVEGFDMFVEGDTITVLSDGEPRARLQLQGLSDFLMGSRTQVVVRRDPTGRQDAIRIFSPADPAREFVVVLEGP